MSIFLCSFLVNNLTGAPLLVQLTGATFFAPMFFGGVIAGTISDRFDRKQTMLRQFVVLIPMSIAMGVIVFAGAVQAWMTYPFILAVGLGGVVDMTSRRALVFDIVGEKLITNALALETLSMASGTTLGALFGGALVDFLGMAQAFFAISGFYTIALLLLLRVPSVEIQKISGSRSMVRDLRDGLTAVRDSKALVGVLGVTAIMASFYFSFTPLVPVFAEKMKVDALLTGLLASATGMGMLAGSFTWATLASPRRGLLYVTGAAICLVSLFGFAAIQVFPVALVLLLCAGVGWSAVGTMQGVLVMTTVGPEMRGRAMGMLSMTIGILPFSMASLGLVAQAIGPARAVIGSTTVGAIALAAWVLLYPEMRRLR